MQTQTFSATVPKHSENRGFCRYSFNGKEKDDEVYGVDGSFQDYGMRMYDTRVCRFWGVDPITKEYPELTPYQFSSNTPISAVDLDGKEGVIVTKIIFPNKTAISITTVVNDNEPQPLGGGVLMRVADFSKTNPTFSATYQSPIVINKDNQASGGNSFPVPASIAFPKTQLNFSGIIKENTNTLGLFEMYLESPSSTMTEAVKKGLASAAYSTINAPYILFTNRTLGGSEASEKRMDAFVDFAPSIISLGLTKTGAVTKTLEGTGFTGYNDFIKKNPGILKKTTDYPIGLHPASNTGRLYKGNKIQQSALKSGGVTTDIIDAAGEVKDAVEEKGY